MKPSVELEIEKLLPGGPGLARNGGEAVLLPAVLPGEIVEAELLPPRRGVRWGRVLKTLRASPWRRSPDCPLAGACGGCDFSHVEPAQALGLKAEAALSELAETWRADLELIESPLQERYRFRAVLHLGRLEDGSFSLGFYGRQRNLIAFESCLLLSPGLEELIGPLRLWAAGLGPEASGAEVEIMEAVEGGGRFIFFRPLPANDFRPGRRSAPLFFSQKFLAALETLPRQLLELGMDDASVFALDQGSPRRLSPQGPDRLAAVVWPQWDLTLKAAPGGFTQVNPAVNRLMVEKILLLAGPLAPGRALDLYSGLGNLALPLAHSGFQVLAVEDSPQSVKAARENAKGLKSFEIIRGRSEKAVSELATKGARFDLVLLDPPRAGARDLAPAIASLNPRRIIYVACHPAVLGRDLPAFVSLGYKLERLFALDMFPRTSHLETLAVLDR